MKCSLYEIACKDASKECCFRHSCTVCKYRKDTSVTKEELIKETIGMNEKDIYKAAILEFGENAQKVKSIEEMAELTQALIKEILNGKGSSNVEEEIADVQIMLNQLKMMYDPKEINKFIDFKLKRLGQIVLRK
ncbi:MAG: hypothetical protein ACRDA4_10640 [Filifactoraceae bacterium]